MSYTEFHKGKLQILARGNKEVYDYIEANNLQDIIKESGWADETDFDTNDDNYIILHKDGIFYGDNCEHILCKFIEHTESYQGGGDIIEVNRIGKDEYEFTCMFYNGGTYLEEILSEEVSKLDKQEWNPNEDTIKITSRESYMIMDAISYALDMLPNHDNYLYCNYSHEELAKCAKKFGDLNIKNQW